MVKKLAGYFINTDRHFVKNKCFKTCAQVLFVELLMKILGNKI